MAELRSKYLMAFAIGMGQVVITILLSMLFISVPRENKIFPGVFINGIDVSGMTKEEAINKIVKQIDRDAEETIVLKEGKRQWSYSLKELGYDINIDQAVDAAVGVGDARMPLKKAMDFMRVKAQQRHITVQRVVDDKKLEEKLKEHAKEMEIKPNNALIEFRNGEFKLIPDREGLTLDIAETKNRIDTVLAKAGDNVVIIPVKSMSAEIKTEDLRGMNTLLSFGVTAIDRSNKGWMKHISDAVKALDGTIVGAGDVFSFNQLMWGKEKRDGIDVEPTSDNMTQTRLKSNGQSQVASTLYQAILYAGLKVESRVSHYTVPAYASPGFEAVIMTGKADLQFRNTSKEPVYINALIRDNRVVINLLGSKSDKGSYQVASATKKDGDKYTIVTLYRILYTKGVETERSVISEDRYTITP